MREIKFRAWNGKEMKTAFDLSQNPRYWWEENKDYPLMQYTGLKDKNDVEIYEGDIIEQLSERTYESVKGTVKYIDGSYLLEYLSGDDGCYLFDEVAYNQVLGNIYENPELLEESL